MVLRFLLLNRHGCCWPSLLLGARSCGSQRQKVRWDISWEDAMQSNRDISSREEMLQVLMQRAILTLGAERAADVRPTLEDVTEALWHLAQQFPARDELPGFWS